MLTDESDDTHVLAGVSLIEWQHKKADDARRAASVIDYAGMYCLTCFDRTQYRLAQLLGVQWRVYAGRVCAHT